MSYKYSPGSRSRSEVTHQSGREALDGLLVGGAVVPAPAEKGQPRLKVHAEDGVWVIAKARAGGAGGHSGQKLDAAG